MEFKEKLKNLRRKNDMTQKELADKIFVSRSAVAKWENGLGLPSDASIEELCKIFNITKEELLGNDIEEKIEKNKTIFKQKKFIIGLSSLLVSLVTMMIILIVVFNNQKDGYYAYEVIKSPKISLSGNSDYYTNDVQIIKNNNQNDIYTNALVKEINIENLKSIKKHKKEEIYQIELDFEYENIEVSYYYLNSNYEYVKKTEGINKLSFIWYYPNEYKAVLEENKFKIEESNLMNLIYVRITVEGINYHYYFLYE